MLVPVRNIDAWIVTIYQPDDPTQDEAVRTYIRGAQSIRSQVAYDGRLLHTSYERQGSTDLFKNLKVRAYPSVIFVDADNSTTITRISGNITAEKVAKVMLEINQLRRNASGQYFWPNGNVFAVEGKPGNSDFGLGLFNIEVPKLLWLLAGIVTTGKTLDSSSKLGQVGYGTASAYAWKKYFES